LPNVHRQHSWDNLSPLFLEYYWPLEVKYHIRQGIDPDKDPIVMRLIRQSVYAGMIMEGETLADFRRRIPDKHNTLLAGLRYAFGAKRTWRTWTAGKTG
jgi:hypothetical protein